MSGATSTAERLRARPVPAWFEDAKLGIFVHWGPYSVPAFAPLAEDFQLEGMSFARNPYAEWYRNTMRIEGSPTRAHHAERYGVDFPYERFGERFSAAIRGWDPLAWADLFRRAGARYAVLTTKHHDGFLLWPSEHRNPKAPDYVASRDVVGELAAAVRSRGLRMGLYYSGGLDWLWHDVLIDSPAALLAAIPRDPAYVAYASAHWRELVDRYLPCSMWNDIGFPGDEANVWSLFEDFYAHVPDGVTNDRFRLAPGPDGPAPVVHCDFRTPEYRAVREIRAKKWELCRGIGSSFGYNAQETDAQYLSPARLVALLVDVVSKNGNLLLDVGPTAEGEIPAPQRTRLEALGAWLDVCGDAIYGTRPWIRAEGRCADGRPVRFTRKGDTLYAIVLGTPAGRTLVLEDVPVPAGARVRRLGDAQPLDWRAVGSDLAISLPDQLPESPAHAFEITGVLPD
jgi:alpha-L-fucosidase